MFATCVGAKKEQPEDWKNRVETLNMRICQPPLPASEIVTLQKQHEKKEYGFPCEQEPLKSFCNKSQCRLKAFGIGGASIDVSISGLSVVKSEPPIWFCDVGGKRVELTTEELQTPQRFQGAVMNQVFEMPPTMKIADWQSLVSSMMQNMNEIEVPEELTYKGQFVSHLESFCTGRVQAQSPEEISLGKPFTEEGKVYFKLEALMKFRVSRSENKRCPSNGTSNYLRASGHRQDHYTNQHREG
jgi:hypothetical protein